MHIEHCTNLSLQKWRKTVQGIMLFREASEILHGDTFTANSLNYAIRVNGCHAMDDISMYTVEALLVLNERICTDGIRFH